ncbi:hypothetical protein ACFLVF_01695 [Chloroflexota bacterium]
MSSVVTELCYFCYNSGNMPTMDFVIQVAGTFIVIAIVFFIIIKFFMK